MMVRSYAILLLFITFTSLSGLVILCEGSPCKKSGEIDRNNPLTVHTKLGQVEGVEDSLSQLGGQKVKSFLGIPFAKPPIGKLRYQAPQKAKAWTGIRDAKINPKSCPQVKSLFQNEWSAKECSEDCLYMNVFVPSNVQTSSAVMVWIHGGGFSRGSSTPVITNGRFLAAITGTIIVSFNYRLGSFGFLDLGNNVKNIGMLDQIAALKWVRDNIESFGGNPKNVTLFGQSAGAVSASMHLLSPLSKGLFHRAILQSGSAISNFGYYPPFESQRRSKDLISKLWCNNDTSVKILDCMRKRSMEEILDKQEKEGNALFQFYPTIDGKFLPKTPEEILAEECFEKVPIIIGATKDEASFLLGPFINKAVLDTKSKLHNFFSLLFAYYPRTPYRLDPEFIDRIKKQYTPPKAQQTNFSYNFNALKQAGTDSTFLCPLQKYMSNYAEIKSDVYSYYFTQPLNIRPEDEILGVSHGVDLYFTFSLIQQYGIQAGFTQEQINFSKKVMQMWGNFAKRGDPNLKGAEEEAIYPVWPKYSGEGQEYMELNLKYMGETEMPMPTTKLRKKDCDQWKIRDSMISKKRFQCSPKGF